MLQDLSIAAVIGGALVDSINPCAFAVIIILMASALAISSKRRALWFGLAFTASIYISYFLMGLGIYKAFEFIHNSGVGRIFYTVIACLAILFGLLNIKDYFWYGKGVLMEVPLKWRPKMKSLLKGATSPLGAFIIGFAVSLFELPCTGGPYMVILGLLSSTVTFWQGVPYLLLYNAVFVLPLLIITLIVYKGLATTEGLEKIRKDKIILLHLIAGILMLGIAAIMFYMLATGQI